MSVSVTMPRLGESVTEGTVTRWLKNEGDHVQADEPLLEVSTDKVDTEVPSPASGVLMSIKVQVDETVEIGVELAVINGADEAATESEVPAAEDREVEAPPKLRTPEEPAQPEEPERAAAAPAAGAAPSAAEAPVAAWSAQAPAPAATAGAHAPAPQAPAATAPAPSGNEEEAAGAYVTPLVRKLASEHGVDLSTIEGTGAGGRIRKSDVLAAVEEAKAAGAGPRREPEAPVAAPERAPEPPVAAASAPAVAPVDLPQRERVEKLSRRRQLIAARMLESLQTSAQLTTVVEVDVTRIARLREAAKREFEAREGVKLSFLPFFAVATVEALKVHPALNASIDTDAGTITYHNAAHLGIAVDAPAGLTVPVIHNAGDLSLGGLARKIADLAERTRTNKISPDELSGGTFTLTNTGSRGALFDTPILNQPQVGILGTGLVVRRPMVVSNEDLGETIAIRSVVYLGLTYDHRIVDGADAARFLGTIRDRLETGNFEHALGLR